MNYFQAKPIHEDFVSLGVSDGANDWDEFRKFVDDKKVAIVHDQLYTIGGAEKVLKQLLDFLPQADLYALFDLLDDADRRSLTGGRKVYVTVMQKLPFLSRLRKFYFPMMPFAIEQLDLTRYDIIVSSSYLVAKGVLTAPDQIHVCYMHSPMRYAWDQQANYLDQIHSNFGVRRMIARLVLHYIRGWDARSTNGVDLILVNSEFVGRRANKAYRRTSKVLYPPVDIEAFESGGVQTAVKNRFVTMCRLVEGKRVHLLVDAFRHLPDCTLDVIGDGPLMRSLKASAPENVNFLGRLSDQEVVERITSSTAFVYAAEEDFGIAPVEAQACGIPVVAPRRGGTGETVRDLALDDPAPTGILFDEATGEAIAAAVRLVVDARDQFTAQNCRSNARRFGRDEFKRGFARHMLSLSGRKTLAEQAFAA